MGKRLRLRRKTREAPVGTLEVLEEVGDAPGTTRHSVDAEPDINKVALHPERYIEINIIKKTRVVDSFYIFAIRVLRSGTGF